MKENNTELFAKFRYLLYLCRVFFMMTTICGKKFDVNNGNSLCREIRTIFFFNFIYLKVCNFQLFFVSLRCKTNLNTNFMKEEKVNKRIGNLQLRKESYLGKEPKHVSYHIHTRENH